MTKGYVYACYFSSAMSPIVFSLSGGSSTGGMSVLPISNTNLLFRLCINYSQAHSLIQLAARKKKLALLSKLTKMYWELIITVLTSVHVSHKYWSRLSVHCEQCHRISINIMNVCQCHADLWAVLYCASAPNGMRAS